MVPPAEVMKGSLWATRFFMAPDAPAKADWWKEVDSDRIEDFPKDMLPVELGLGLGWLGKCCGSWVVAVLL